MVFFRIPKRVVEGVQALQDVSARPAQKRPARKAPFEVDDGAVLITNDKFAGDFTKLVKFCEDNGMSDVIIHDPLRPDFKVRFTVGGDFGRDDPQNTVQFLRERGVASALGTHDRVAIIGGNRRFYGYLRKEADLPLGLAQHAVQAPAEDAVLLVRSLTANTEPLPRGHISSNAIGTAYGLYETLREMPTNGDSLTVSHIVGERRVPAYKIWRPDAPIGTEGREISLGGIAAKFHHGEPALVRVTYGVGQENELTAIVTAADYALPENQVVVSTPFILPGMEGAIPLSHLDCTYDVERRVGRLTSLTDNWTLLIDQRPAARLYRPDAAIATGLQGNYPWSRVMIMAKMESLAAMFHRAGGPVLVVPEWWEQTKPSRIAIMTPPESKA